MAEVLRIDEDCVLYEGAPATPEARRRLVRRFLSDRLGVPESDLRLSTTSAGQPVIENGGHLAVSWAHRSCFLFIGVAEGLVGVDLELAEHDLPIGDLVAAFFCKNERRVMRRLAPPERLEAFLLLWTIREAYLKALGHGLDVPLAHDLDFSPILRSHPAQGYIAQTICGPGVARAHLISRRVPLEGRWLRLTKISASERPNRKGEDDGMTMPARWCGRRRWLLRVVSCILMALGQVFLGPSVGASASSFPMPAAAVYEEEESEEEESEEEEEQEDTETEPDEPERTTEDDWFPGEFSGDVDLVSDYVDRGVSNTDHNPALQGGLEYTVNIGLEYAQPYFGVWASNVDFNDDDEATLELDYLFGLRGEITDIEWYLGGIRTTYPGASNDLNYDYWETSLGARYPLFHGVSILGNYLYSPDYFGASGNAHYLQGGFNWETPLGSTILGLEAVTGHQWIEHNDVFGVRDYQDWRIGISAKIERITLGVAYTDTDLSKRECGGRNLCEARAVFRIGAGF